jgi:plasmid stabilization system protein ParE
MPIWMASGSRPTSSREQANPYARQLDERILGLAETPERGGNREAIRAGYHSIHVGRHIVFYTLTEEIVGLERVLHDQMDAERHL